MTPSRRLAVTATAAAVLLAATVAVTAVATGPAAVAGSPAAEDGPVKRVLTGATPSPLPRTTPSTSTPPPTSPPASTQQPEPPPPQPANTVRLARGGTATLVPMEVVDGVLPVPDGVREAAWWGAPLDGQTGATVLAGHVNWRGAKGPFAELWQSELGDQATVVAPDGRVFQFRVRQLVTVHKTDLPRRAQELFGQQGNHRLVLVTCGGRWVGGENGYEENRVVIADRL